MKFHSIKEYFYKLTTIGFILLLPPLLVLIFLYYYFNTHNPLILDSRIEKELLYVLAIVFFLALTIVHWLYFERLKKLRKHLELAAKMDGFYSLTLMKLSSYSACGLMAAGGFFLTANVIFTGFSIFSALGIILQWPTPRAFCRQFDLRGADREMMVQGGDLYQKNRRTR